MLEMIDIGIDRAVAFRMEGKFTKSEMVQVLSEAKAKIELYKKIVVYEEITSFSGIELKGIVEEFKFLHEVGISNIEKMAVVTDKKWEFGGHNTKLLAERSDSVSSQQRTGVKVIGDTPLCISCPFYLSNKNGALSLINRFINIPN